jgi:multidrug efflux pump subunit AcrB
LRGALLGLIGVFILLSFQFRSYVEPLMVLAVIPLALIGVVLGHVLMRLDVTMPSMLGFASLAGIVVNDSILLVLFLKMQRSAGTPPLQAAGQASRQRFRAVLITSATTIAGLLPLTLERSLQAQILIPLAVSIVFGLLASTVLVLSVIPSVYMVLHDLGLTAHTGRAHDVQLSRLAFICAEGDGGTCPRPRPCFENNAAAVVGTLVGSSGEFLVL